MLRPDVEEALDAHFDRFVFGVGFCEMGEEQCQGLSVFECLRAALLLIGQLEILFKRCGRGCGHELSCNWKIWAFNYGRSEHTVKSSARRITIK